MIVKRNTDMIIVNYMLGMHISKNNNQRTYTLFCFIGGPFDFLHEHFEFVGRLDIIFIHSPVCPSVASPALEEK